MTNRSSLSLLQPVTLILSNCLYIYICFLSLKQGYPRIRVYRQICSEADYIARVGHLDLKSLDMYGCQRNDGGGMPKLVDHKIKGMLDKEDALWDPSEDKRKNMSIPDMLIQIGGVLTELRMSKPHEELLTNYLMIEIPHEANIELRDIPGTGHGDWRFHRDVWSSSLVAFSAQSTTASGTTKEEGVCLCSTGPDSRRNRHRVRHPIPKEAQYRGISHTLQVRPVLGTE